MCSPLRQPTAYTVKGCTVFCKAHGYPRNICIHFISSASVKTNCGGFLYVVKWTQPHNQILLSSSSSCRTKDRACICDVSMRTNDYARMKRVSLTSPSRGSIMPYRTGTSCLGLLNSIASPSERAKLCETWKG